MVITMKIEIKRLTKTAVLPVRGSAAAAGYDLCADIAEPISLLPGEAVKVDIGIAVAIPEGYFGGVFARSGISTKKGLRPANCTGVIDADYRGPLMVPLYNDSEKIRTIEPGERIAQLIILPCLTADFIEVETLGETERGGNGFGSTGQ